MTARVIFPIPPKPAKHPRGHRHTAQTMLVVQKLAEAGWSRAQIRQLLAQEGIRMSKETVSRYVDPSYAERTRQQVRERKAARNARNAAVRLPGSTPPYKLARLKALKALGLGDEDVGKVMGLDFGERLSRSQVKRALNSDEWPRFYKTGRDEAAV